MPNLLLVEKKTHFELVINRPKSKNAVDPVMAQVLQASLKGLQKRATDEASPLVVVIRSSSPSVFCAGGDLKAYEKMKSKAEGVKVNRLMTQNLANLKTLPFYTIAFVEGLCVGGGCEWALACDAIWVTSNAEFVFGQSRVGLTPGWGGAAMLVDRVGVSLAKKYLLTAQKIFTSEALAVGLAQSATDNLERDIKLLGESLPKDRNLLEAIKKITYDSDIELSQFEKLWWSTTHKEKLKKFVGKAE